MTTFEHVFIYMYGYIYIKFQGSSQSVETSGNTAATCFFLVFRLVRGGDAEVKDHGPFFKIDFQPKYHPLFFIPMDSL